MRELETGAWAAAPDLSAQAWRGSPSRARAARRWVQNSTTIKAKTTGVATANAISVESPELWPDVDIVKSIARRTA
jgi:hypothetical protein